MSDSKPQVATIDQEEPGDRPILEGEVFTPAILADFERRAQDYVEEASEVTEELAVRYVARGIKSETFRLWYTARRDMYDVMTLTKFMNKIRLFFLPTDWSSELRKTIYVSAQGTRTFHEWALEAVTSNSYLPTHMRLPSDSLRALLEARLKPKLGRLLIRNPPTLTQDVTKDVKVEREEPTMHVKSTITKSWMLDNSQRRLTEWLGHVRKLDEQVREDAEDQRKAVAEALRADRSRRT